MIRIDSENQYDSTVGLFRLLTKLGLKSQVKVDLKFKSEYAFDFERRSCCNESAVNCYCDPELNYDMYDEDDDRCWTKDKK